MGTLYFDCSMGAAGDMISAALFELTPNKHLMLHKLNHLGLSGIKFIPEKCEKQGIQGTNLTVLIHGEAEDMGTIENTIHHHHMTLKDIKDIVSEMKVSNSIKKSVYEIYNIIAEAESKAHKCRVEEVHFHEVGAMDAIADITAACMLMQELCPDKVIVSPIHVGSSTVTCAHGILPVPAPATKNILEDVPYYSSEIQGELCTPTGAAILRYFADTFKLVKSVGGVAGRGIGKRDFVRPNVLTVYAL